MSLRQTETVHRDAGGLDLQPPHAILRVLAGAQAEAAKSVSHAIESIASAAEAVAGSLAGGGRLAYAAAGSSGLMALADALELPGTYGIARDRIVVLIAGGAAALQNLAGAPEDDEGQGRRDVEGAGLAASDCLIAVSASGSTPYALGALRAAGQRGVATIAIANNGGAPLLAEARLPILLPTPPEVIAGSTRMGAGTAQKIALNMLSTLAAVHLGHVHDGYMVNLLADNAKLRDRSARIVAAVAGIDPAEAGTHLETSGGSVKAAILMAAGVGDVAAAQELLDRTGQKLRPALSSLKGNT